MKIGPWALIVFASCVSPSENLVDSGLDGDAAVADSGLPSAEDAGAATCELVSAPTHLSLSEGSRLQIDLEASPSNATLELVSLPSGLSGQLQGRTLRLRANYGLTGSRTLELRLHCPRRTLDVSLSVEIRPLKWGTALTWAHDTANPEAREHPQIWLDEADPNRLLLFGGFGFEPTQYTPLWDLWELNLATGQWQALTPSTEPPHRVAGRWAPGPGPRELLYFGGDDLSSTTYSLYRFSYAPDQLKWTSEPSTNPGMAMSLGSFVRDSARDRYISACGFRGTTLDCAVDAFSTADSGQWSTLPVAPGPSPRYGFFSTYDATNERLIVFSGAQAYTPANPINAAQDTWALELASSPPKWQKLSGASSPALGRRNGCSAMDPVGNRFFIWGGTADGQTTLQGLQVMSLERGEEQWRTVDVQGTAPSRSSCTAVYDGARKRILFGFGNNETDIFADFQVLEL